MCTVKNAASSLQQQTNLLRNHLATNGLYGVAKSISRSLPRPNLDCVMRL